MTSETELRGRANYRNFIDRAVDVLHRTKQILGHEEPVSLRFISTRAPRSRNVFLDSEGTIVVIMDLTILLMDDEELTGVFIHELLHKKHRKQFLSTMERVLREVVGTSFLDPKVDSVTFSYSRSFAEFYVVHRRAYQKYRQETERILKRSCIAPQNQLDSIDAFFRCLVAASILESVEAIPLIREIADDWKANRTSKIHINKIRNGLRDSLVEFSTERVV